MRRLLAIFSLLSLCQFASSQILKHPVGYTLLNEAEGDLDKDGLLEKAIVYNRPDTNAETGGINREIIIYKQYQHEWLPWHRSTEAILDSQSGGVMGDPFQEIEIVQGILHITHAGGSSWKWGHTDKYRFQFNRFELIGYTANYGKPCEYWMDVDFNVATGKIVIKKAFEKCDENGDPKGVYKKENENFSFRLKESIHLGNRHKADIKILSPRYRHEIYL